MSKLDNVVLSARARNPFHIAKRDELAWWKAWGIRIIAVVLALVVCGIITVALTKINPVKMYLTMIEGFTYSGTYSTYVLLNL